MATPATGALMGTPASISASVEPQTEAWEVEPLEDMTSETSADGVGELLHRRESSGSSARSASAPWPISRRPGLRRGFASPVE